MFAADVQHRAQRNSTQCNIVAHVQKQAVQVLPQLHRLHRKYVRQVYAQAARRDDTYHGEKMECFNVGSYKVGMSEMLTSYFEAFKVFFLIPIKLQ